MTPDRNPPPSRPAARARRSTPAPLFAGAALFLSIAAAPPPAIAQPASPGVSPEASAIASTDQLYSQGVAAAKRDDWQAAYQNFLAAWKIKRQYQIGAQLARAELRLGKSREAAEHLAVLLAEFSEISQDDRGLLRQMLAQAQSTAAALIIKVNREGAEILVDGAAVGVSPMSRDVYVEPGKHVVEARMGNGESDKIEVDLTGGQSRQVGLTPGAPKGGPESDPRCPPGEACDPEDGEGPNRIVLIAGGTVAGVGIVAGTILVIAGASVDGSGDGEFTAAGWSFVLGGAAGITTLIYALTSTSTDKKPTQTALRAAPLIGPEGGGVLVSGRW